MKIAEISKKPNKELQKLLNENHEKLRQLRFDLAAGKVKDIRAIRVIKKDIARILTTLNSQNKS